MSKYCPKCGNELPDDAQFCNECGYSVLVDNNHTDEETPKEVMKLKKLKLLKKMQMKYYLMKLQIKLNQIMIWILKYLATKLHLTFLKTKY